MAEIFFAINKYISINNKKADKSRLGQRFCNRLKS